MTINIQYKKFEFIAILFRLTNALIIFRFIINNILWPYFDKFAIIYFNDIVIYFKTKEDYLEYIKKVLKVLSNHQLYAKPSKYIIGVKNLEYYEHIVGNNTINLIASNIKIIDKWPIFKTIYKV